MSRSCYVPTTYRPYLLYNRDHPSQGWINVRFFLLFGVLNVLMSCQTRCMTRPKITWKCGTRNQKSTTCALKQDQTHLQSTFLILVFPRQLSNMYKNFELFSNSCTSYGSQLDIIYIYILYVICVYICVNIYIYIHFWCFVYINVLKIKLTGQDTVGQGIIEMASNNSSQASRPFPVDFWRKYWRNCPPTWRIIPGLVSGW